MPCVVISGAPGSGKSTLLAELTLLGFRTVPESARAIIAERLESGKSRRPEPEEFAREILRRDTEKYRAVSEEKEWVFFDRSAVEAVAMVSEASKLAYMEMQVALVEFRFHRKVFLLPPWREIYTTDSERDHTFEHAERVHESLVSCYSRCGYEIEFVPPGPPKERALHVLHDLEYSAA